MKNPNQLLKLLCMKCHYQAYAGQRQEVVEQRGLAKINYASISPQFRLKKMDYENNMHDNSEDFKNLGSLH